MEAPMLKRRLNPFLLATTILVLSLLAGLSVMYSGVIEDKVEQTRNLNETLEQKNQKLADLKQEKAELNKKLTNRQQDVDRYVSIVRDLNSTVEELKTEKANLESEVENLEANLSNTSDTLEDLNTTFGLVCSTEGENLSETNEQRCENWGHDID